MSFLGIVYLVLLYFLMILPLTLAASQKKIGKLKVFLISLFLTPIAGLLVYRFSDPVTILHYTRYRCPKCGLDFTEPMIDCPYCRKDGEITKLHPMMMRSI